MIYYIWWLIMQYNNKNPKIFIACNCLIIKCLFSYVILSKRNVYLSKAYILHFISFAAEILALSAEPCVF